MVLINPNLEVFMRKTMMMVSAALCMVAFGYAATDDVQTQAVVVAGQEINYGDEDKTPKLVSDEEEKAPTMFSSGSYVVSKDDKGCGCGGKPK